MQIKSVALASAIAILCLAGPIMGFAGVNAEDSYSYETMDIQGFDVSDVSDVNYEDAIFLDEINTDELTESIYELDSNLTLTEASADRF